MAKEKDEFKRRLLKIGKHTDALRQLVVIQADQDSLDTIDKEIRSLSQRREDPDVQALAHSLEPRKGPKAVAKG